MADLVLDSYAVACPKRSWYANPELFIDSLLAYFRKLVGWQQLRRFDQVRFLTDEDIIGALADEECFPLWNALDEALQEAGAHDDFQLQDINTIVTSLLQQSEHIESLAGVEDLVLDTYEIVNDCVSTRTPRFSYHLARLLALKGIMDRTNPQLGELMRLASTGEIGSEQIQAEATLLTCQHVNGTWEDEVVIKGTIGCYVAPARFFSDFSPVAWWKRGTTSACTEALLLSCLQSGQALEALDHLQSRTLLGRTFVSSARRLGFIHDDKKVERIIRSCREVVLRTNLAAIHHLRVGLGANEPPHKRGKFTSWRRDIDDEFHLHYWDDGVSVEFADVVVHNDFSITA